MSTVYSKIFCMNEPIYEPVDRFIDFNRTRWLSCPGCLHLWESGWEFVEGWDNCQTGCPSCGIFINDDANDRSLYVSSPNEPMVDDAALRRTSWFHTSFHSDWPRSEYNPLDDHRPGFPEYLSSVGLNIEEWADQQRANALHVGTYEAAVANFYRRMDQEVGYHDLNFHLYRLQLSKSSIIRPGVFREMASFMGNTTLNDACPLPNEVTRYINVYEDGGVCIVSVETKCNS